LEEVQLVGKTKQNGPAKQQKKIKTNKKQFSVT